MMQYAPSTSYNSNMSTGAPAGCLITQRDLGHGIHVDVISVAAPSLEFLLDRWDGTQMTRDNMLPERVQWASNVAVARIVQLTGVDSYKDLVYHGGGKGRHLWLDPNVAAYVASQASSPRSVEYSQVSESVYLCRSVKSRPSSELCLVQA